MKSGNEMKNKERGRWADSDVVECEREGPAVAVHEAGKRPADLRGQHRHGSVSHREGLEKEHANEGNNTNTFIFVAEARAAMQTTAHRTLRHVFVTTAPISASHTCRQSRTKAVVIAKKKKEERKKKVRKKRRFPLLLGCLVRVQQQQRVQW